MEAVAFQGVRVFETLKKIAKQVLVELKAVGYIVGFVDHSAFCVPESGSDNLSQSTNRRPDCCDLGCSRCLYSPTRIPQLQSCIDLFRRSNRSWLGIPNFGNVVFKLAVFVGRPSGMAFLLRPSNFLDFCQRWPYMIAFVRLRPPRSGSSSSLVLEHTRVWSWTAAHDHRIYGNRGGDDRGARPTPG